MESIVINSSDYYFIKDFKHIDKIRTSFNKLAQKTFGIHFEDWYKSGFWKQEYVPYALLDGEDVVANLSLSTIEFEVLGEKKRYAQIGTVMTDEGYRNKGLSKWLMEYVLNESKDKYDLIYLFANDSVVNYYPKFGFEKADEYQYSQTIESAKDNNDYMRKLDMKNENDKSIFVQAISNSVPISKMAMRRNTSLIMFYCLSFMSDSVYYIDSLDTAVVANINGSEATIIDVFAPREAKLKTVVDCICNSETSKVYLGFTPPDTNEFDCELLVEEDTTLFVMGRDKEMLKTNKLRFPILSHT